MLLSKVQMFVARNQPKMPETGNGFFLQIIVLWPQDVATCCEGEPVAKHPKCSHGKTGERRAVAQHFMTTRSALEAIKHSFRVCHNFKWSLNNGSQVEDYLYVHASEGLMYK